jgi:hypothetical protein
VHKVLTATDLNQEMEMEQIKKISSLRLLSIWNQTMPECQKSRAESKVPQRG